MQRNNDDGPVMLGHEEPREVVIEAADHVLGPAGSCSCCHGPARVGVRIFTKKRKRFAATDGHIFYCVRCSSRIGFEGAKAGDL